MTDQSTLTGCWINSNSHTTNVENSLRYEILIADEKDCHMKLVNRMKHYNVPGVSIAIIDDGKVEWAKGYGNITNHPNAQCVTSTTLFQAGSISKSLTAMGILLLIQQGKLSLDENVNTYLKSWKVPENKFTKKEKVTLRRLLSHTAGTNVHGFPGYLSDSPTPSVLEILGGKNPRVNTDPVNVTEIPGKEHRYSGGGTTIIQLLIEDVTGERFEVWMHKNILLPCNMHSSTFSQPLSQSYRDFAAYGHDAQGKMIPGKWHTYPEMAAAGLWTTPTDLAHFLITILRILHDEQKGLITKGLIDEALKPQSNSKGKDSEVGLGFFFSGLGNAMSFGHGGVNEGFIANTTVWPKLGVGFVIMTNGDQGGDLINEIKNSITDVYKIPGNEPKTKKTMNIDPSSSNKFTGVYENDGHTFTVNMRNNKLFVLDSYLSHEIQIYPEKENVFFMREGPMFSLQFIAAHDQIENVILFGKSGERVKDAKGDIVLKKNTLK